MNIGEKLRQLRARLAAEEKVPAYIVFSDAALSDMCRVRPTRMEVFLTVSGVGKRKAEKYGEEFCQLIKEHISMNPDDEIPPEDTDDPMQKQLDSLREMVVGRKLSSAPKAWTEEEEKRLSEEYSKGMTVADMARAHKRTNGAITARLKKMGIIG